MFVVISFSSWLLSMIFSFSSILLFILILFITCLLLSIEFALSLLNLNFPVWFEAKELLEEESPSFLILLWILFDLIFLLFLFSKLLLLLFFLVLFFLSLFSVFCIGFSKSAIGPHISHLYFTDNFAKCFLLSTLESRAPIALCSSFTGKKAIIASNILLIVQAACHSSLWYRVIERQTSILTSNLPLGVKNIILGGRLG